MKVAKLNVIAFTNVNGVYEIFFEAGRASEVDLYAKIRETARGRNMTKVLDHVEVIASTVRDTEHLSIQVATLVVPGPHQEEEEIAEMLFDKSKYGVRLGARHDVQCYWIHNRHVLVPALMTPIMQQDANHVLTLLRLSKHYIDDHNGNSNELPVRDVMVYTEGYLTYICPMYKDSPFCVNPFYIGRDEKIHLSRWSIGPVINSRGTLEEAAAIGSLPDTSSIRHINL